MTNVSLTPELQGFAERCVASGRHDNVSEVMRAALRLLQHQEERRAAFTRMLEAAEREADETGWFEGEQVADEMDAIIAEAEANRPGSRPAEPGAPTPGHPLGAGTSRSRGSSGVHRRRQSGRGVAASCRSMGSSSPTARRLATAS